jgi:hypothetical protein
MKTISTLLLMVTAATAFACGDYLSLNSPRILAGLALSGDQARAEKAIRKLRSLGPEGLEAFLDVHASTLAQSVQPEPSLQSALDRISGQRDARASRLFWHTDFEQAKAAAQKLNRPILSLRLLGRLDEELSCANSRFFRVALYPNKEINEILRREFVLHWESVRPAPRITVDFGDGRKLERTITGNSIHYILAPDGQPIEALPGLYGPRAFLAQLQAAVTLARQYASTEPSARSSVIRQYHSERLAEALANWSADLAQLEGSQREANPVRSTLESLTSSERWVAIARLHNGDARLDNESRKLIRVKNARALDAGRISVAKSAAEDPLLRAMGEFERSMAEDTVRNEYQLHTQIHEWFTQGGLDVVEVARLNNRVYAELFMMPRWDPWLGLRPPNGYSGVESDGTSIAALVSPQ